MHHRITEDTIEMGPIQKPTLEQFSDFFGYMKTLENRYRSHYGLVKNIFIQFEITQIIPPMSWKPRNTPYSKSLRNLIIKNPIEQNAEGKQGVYQFKHIASPSMKYEDYVEQNRNRDQYISSKKSEEVEELFWKSIVYSPPLYGADLSATLMDEISAKWNLDHLDTILNHALLEKIRGVNTSYCYIGSWKSLFCWHKEDLDLSAINYLHFGKPKFWYCIQSDDGYVIEDEAKKNFPHCFNKCSQYLRHKTILINPYKLKRKNVKLRICKMQQNQGEFIIAFGGAYHCGFNFGCNVAEAVNFATYSWLDSLLNSKPCICRKSSVKASFSAVITQLAKNPEISNDPEFIKIWESVGIEKLTQQEEQRKEELKRTKAIAKNAKKSASITNSLTTGQYIKCYSCRKKRKIPKNTRFTSKYLKDNQLLCSMLNKKCIKSDSNRFEDEEQEYKPYE